MLGCPAGEVQDQVGSLFRQKAFEGMQVQNPLGIGFTLSLALLLKRFCPSSGYDFHTEEAIGQDVCVGLKDAPRRASDIVVTRAGDEVAIISAKWSVRHDRLKDLLEECEYFRVVRPSVDFYVATNEYMPARLRKLLVNRCIEDTFHVNRSLLMLANGGNNRLAGVRDLSELFTRFH